MQWPGMQTQIPYQMMPAQGVNQQQFVGSAGPVQQMPAAVMRGSAGPQQPQYYPQMGSAGPMQPVITVPHGIPIGSAGPMGGPILLGSAGPMMHGSAGPMQAPFRGSAQPMMVPFPPCTRIASACQPFSPPLLACASSRRGAVAD